MQLGEDKATLSALWEDRRKQFDQCMDLQLFKREAEQNEAWMAKQEVGKVRLTSTEYMHFCVLCCVDIFG